MLSFVCKLFLVSLAVVGSRGQQVCTTHQGDKCLGKDEAGAYAGNIPDGQPACFKSQPSADWSFCFYKKDSGSMRSCECAQCAAVTQACDNDGYQCYGAENTMNKYCDANPSTCSGKTIIPATITDDDKKKIVNQHNKLRRKVALGKQDDYNGDTIPGATNMNMLKYSDELAKVAQRFVDQCIFGHDKDRRTPNFKTQPGQNSYMHSSTSAPWKFTESVDAWYAEVENFTMSAAADFQSLTDATSGETVGHFTQVVWAKATRVGCGIKVWTDPEKGNMQVISCNYDKGNLKGTPIYNEGTTVSCPTKPIGGKRGLCKT